MLINLRYRYIVIIQQFELNFKKYKQLETNGRLDLEQINWLLKND
jgi:hypothetical protein